jgi:hypothetical protein
LHRCGKAVLVLPFPAGELSVRLAKGAERCWVGQHRNGFLKRLQVIDSEKDRRGTSVDCDRDPLVLFADAGY